ncbi:MAG: peptidylprolyl isomerase [Luteolibacter sp.]
MIWNDNSTTETHFQVAYTDNSITKTPIALAVGSISNGSTAGSGTVSAGLTGLTAGHTYTFQVRAYTTTPSNASGYSNTITVVTSDFNTPNMVDAITQTDGSILVRWVDNAITEDGYFIEYRALPSGTFSLAGSTGGNFTGFFIGGLVPATSYEFRVRGFKGTAASPTSFTVYSGLGTATTPSTLLAPTSLVVSALAPVESSVKFVFSDNTAVNNGYEFEYRLSGVGSFVFLAESGDGSIINGTGILVPGTAYDFRCRAFYSNGVTRTYSGYSNSTSLTTPFSAPTVASSTAGSENQVNLTWVDNSQAEGGVAVYVRVSGSASYQLYDYAATNATSFSVTGLSPGTAYDFQVAAAVERTAPGTTTIVESARSNMTSVVTKDVFTSRIYQPVTLGVAFSYQATVTTGFTRSSWNITGLPAGLTFNSATGIVSGVPTVTGVFNCPMTATFANGWTTNSSLTLRIVRDAAVPVVDASISGQTLLAGGDMSILLAGKFADPDSESAVRVTTNLGVMDFILYNTATPQTVANFLGYVNNASSSGNYNGAVFHRSVPGFIVQGGAFKTQSAPNNFSVTTTTASPVNEPGISNLRGTVAMAKIGTNPNSATDQFFVNLADNSSNLDNQNGGFTAFARVAGDGMAVADAIAGLPNATYNVNLGGNASSMENWPLTSASAAMDVSKVVVITSAAPVAVLSYSVTGNTNPPAVSVSIVGENLQINALSGGQSDVTVTATDLDGNAVSQTFSVIVNQSPSFTSAAPTATSDVGTAYSFTCTAGGFPVPTFTVSSGALPTGLVLSSSGVISGISNVPGVFTGAITATNSVGPATQNFSITIHATLADWAAGQNLLGADALPGADPDHDGHSNLEEFAFFTNPKVSNTTQLPSFALAAVSAAKYGEVTFPVRKFAPSLTYTVETSGSLSAGTWSTRWTSSDGFGAAAVTSAVDQADRTIITVRDSQSSSSATCRFLRVKVTGQ